MTDSVDDLSTRARGSKLTETERRKLDLALKASFETRLAHRAGCEFDVEDSVLAGDHKITARVVRRVASQFPNPRRHRANVVWLVAVAMLCAGTAALAGAAGFRYFHAQQSQRAPGLP